MSSPQKTTESDHRTYLGDAIVAELRASSLPLDPPQFAFWFAYKSGRDTALKAAADAIKARNGALTGADVQALYDAHLSPFRFGEAPDAAAARLGTKLNELASTLESAIGATEEQRETLLAETTE